jgi:hypothetical protein
MREVGRERMRSMIEKIHYRDPQLRADLRHAGSSFRAYPVKTDTRYI